ncbi:hypothetical protein R1flu_014096 [Riccia fluitans]|uniref:Uncharacterized protein n=1 Tax=Riccia fluitans TaxID=41844 RepID=A0ABD1YFU5_9MARC
MVRGIHGRVKLDCCISGRWSKGTRKQRTSRGGENWLIAPARVPNFVGQTDGQLKEIEGRGIERFSFKSQD